MRNLLSVVILSACYSVAMAGDSGAGEPVKQVQEQARVNQHSDHPQDERNHDDDHDEGHAAGNHDNSEAGQLQAHDDAHEKDHDEKNDEGGHSEMDHGDGHDHGAESDDSGEQHAETVALSVDQQTLAKIHVELLLPRVLSSQLYAPAEIKANGYTSYLVSPRVDSVVLQRQVALGDHVSKGQPLLTLFSETVAEAQANYRLAAAEWLRVQKLGRNAVGDKRHLSAQVEQQAAYGRLQAYGLSAAAIEALADHSTPLGEYTLSVLTAGAVLGDDFHQGQRVVLAML